MKKYTFTFGILSIISRHIIWESRRLKKKRVGDKFKENQRESNIDREKDHEKDNMRFVETNRERDTQKDMETKNVGEIQRDWERHKERYETQREIRDREIKTTRES